MLRIPSSTQIKSRNLKSHKSAKWHFSVTELRTPNSTQNPTVSETPQIFWNTSRHQSENTSKLRIITEQNGTPDPRTLTACGEISRTPNLDFLESKVLIIPFSTQIKSQNLEIHKSAKRHFSNIELRAPNSRPKPNVLETPQTYKNTSKH